MTDGSVEININYPPELSPGEDRYFMNGIEINGYKGKLHIDFFVTGIDIFSNNGVNKVINIDCKKNITNIPLFYHAREDLCPPIRKEIGVKVFQRKFSKLRIAYITILIAMLILPQIAIMMKSSLFSISLTLEQSILVSIPGYLILGLFLATNRLKNMLDTVLKYDLEISSSESSHGVQDIINIRESSKYMTDNMKFSYIYRK